MTQSQARDIVTLIKAATAARVDQLTLDYFEMKLLGLDYELALQAANLGTVTWRKFPPWAEFKEVYRAQQRLAEPVGEQRLDLPPAVETDGGDGKRGDHAPEWVWVWSWCRTKRSPRNLIPLPQQGLPETETSLTMTEYEALRDEWLAAGKPKAEVPIPLAR